MVTERTARILARCNGFRVTAAGEEIGTVATPVFSGDGLIPEYLLVRVHETVPGLFRAVPPDLIATADAGSETLTLRIGPSELASLPEPARDDRLPHGTKPLPPPSPGPPPPKLSEKTRLP